MAKRLFAETVDRGWTDVPLTRLVKADWNYKQEDESLSEKLTANIKRNGQIETVLVRELSTGFLEIINGNHRYEPFKSCGMKEVHVFNMGEISDAQAMRLAIELNETRFPSDPVQLSARVNEILEIFGLEDISSTLPYNEEELKNLLELAKTDWSNYQPSGDGSFTGKGDSDFNRTISLTVTLETHLLWEEWCKRVATELGYDNPAKAFEFAVVEAMNTPLEQITTDFKAKGKEESTAPDAESNPPGETAT